MEGVISSANDGCVWLCITGHSTRGVVGFFFETSMSRRETLYPIAKLPTEPHLVSSSALSGRQTDLGARGVTGNKEDSKDYWMESINYHKPSPPSFGAWQRLLVSLLPYPPSCCTMPSSCLPAPFHITVHVRWGPSQLKCCPLFCMQLTSQIAVVVSGMLCMCNQGRRC